MPAFWEAAQELLTRIDRGGRGVRLLGIGASGLAVADQPRQLSLESRPRNVAAGVVEDVRERFGDEAVFPASLMPHEVKERRDE